MSRTAYDYGDRLIGKLPTDQLFQQLRLRLLAQDEIHSVTVRKEIRTLYDRLTGNDKTALLKIARTAYAAALTDEESKDEPDAEWLMAVVLRAYDEVTRFVYVNEACRKRDRMTEEVLSRIVDGTSLNHPDTVQSFRKHAGYWKRQSQQYAINVTDKAARKAYRDSGVKRVQWRTQGDSRVCSICKKRNGEIYPIDEIPEKHWHCRCWVIPVEENTQP